MRRFKWTGGWLLFLLSLSAAGQEELSLSEAISKGLANNYNITIEKKRVEIAENNNSWGEAGRYPSIDFTLTQSNNITDNVKTASPFQAQGIAISNSVAPAIDLNWTLFNGFKVNITKSVLEKLEMESRGNADIVISNTIQAIILGYYNAVLESERLEVFEETKRLSSDKYDYLKLKKSYGAAVTSDLLLEEGNYLTDSVNYINQQLVLREAMRNLNTLMAVEDVDQRYVFTDKMELKVETYDYGQLEEKMVKENIDLQKQYISQSILKEERRIRQAERMPLLTFNLGGSTNNSRVDYSQATFPGATNTDQFDEPLTSVTNNYAATFRLTFNLFNGGKINRAIKNAYLQEDIGNLQIDQLKLTLKEDLVSSYDGYQVRRQLYGINQRKLEVAELNLDLSEAKFKNGTINSFDYRTIQNNYQLASIQELQSLYDLIEADVSLMRLTGGILEVYK